ncbi:hypothetical protein SAMN05444285_101280 [Draconibacterium orientale]|jgi:hypothetical protein|uniref:DUF5777 domain-containing protein n=2 Tax=Draconibacterium orientale TaxID=1168034 RepID=A0A1H9YQU9_9BACT|nr:DUF5777 family beta-barrel protein [Draconibacterium orientale]SES71443.1 hypothetical protein SAMN05444285_101280 [Draconibacterium orientale]
MMKKYILILIILGVTFSNSFAQEEEADPVYAFNSGILIDAQTSYIPDARTLEFVIQHKFGTLENGKSDLWGIYAPGSNVRLALNYVPVKNLQIGAGITKKFMYSDFNAKYKILQQKTSGMPVSLTVFGNIAIDGRNKSAFGTGNTVESKGKPAQYQFGFTDRLSYFSQAMVTRNFGDVLSLQAGASFTHYNTVEWDYDHDVIGLHFSGKIKFSPQGSFIFNYDNPLKIKDITEQYTWDTHAKENLAVGVEFFTFTHAFQIYVGTAQGILPQDAMMYNQKDWTNKGLAFGFTITRIWMF